MDTLADTTPPPGKPLSRPWRIARNVAIGVVAAIFLVWLVLYITKGRFLKHPFERIAASLTERQVSVGGDFQLYFDPLTIHFRAEGLRVSNPDWASKPDLFAAKTIDSRIAPLSMIFGRRHFYRLDLADSAIDLEWNAAHTQNTWTFGAKSDGKPLVLPTIDLATVAGTTLRYVDPQMGLRTDLAFKTITSTDAKIGAAVRFAGSGQVRDSPFMLTGALLSPNATLARGQNKLVLAADAAHNHLDVTGTLPSLPMSRTCRSRSSRAGAIWRNCSASSA